MANPGGVGAKFMSVNLNKSYGPVSHNSYGQPAGRIRPGNGGGGGGSGSGGGMVVLSRPRPAQKPGPKLSVPPPLNLPSLRKEHERFDSSGPGSSVGGGSCPGAGPRPNSSGMGWTKPSTVALQEKEGNVTQGLVDGIANQTTSVTKLSTGYVPPSARVGAVVVPHSVSAPLAVKTSVLRGEDFPSLKAALPSSSSGGVQKQKDGLHQKQKHFTNEESSAGQTNSSSNSLVHMQPQGQSSHHTIASGSNESGDGSHGLGSSQMEKQQARKQEYFPGPLPLVMLNPRSDWADDERDTGRGFAEKVKEHGFSKNEAYWDREFELPRNSVLPHKPVHSLFERRGKLEDDGGKVHPVEIPKVDPYRRDVRTPGREGNSWRTPPTFPKDGLNAHELAIGRNGSVLGLVVDNREIAKENSKYMPPHVGDNSRDSPTGNREPAFGRRDIGHGNEGRHQWNHIAESSINRGIERSMQEQYVSEHSNRYRGSAQDVPASKSSFPPSGKRVPMKDPKLNFVQRHTFPKSERTYVDEPFAKDFGTKSFDEHDPFSGGIVGVIKRKKDAVKHSDFHDPVRESFEAELERVQKMQEQERQRIIEEQERAMEQAQREEEERQRLIREDEERRRRLEEEAREAAWRAEQERVEAIRRAEEQKIAREEEKQRMLLEEERRKEAAKQKLLELEAKIAMRQTEAPKVVDENTVSKALDFDNWEDGERMVERITTSGSSDSSGLNRPFEMGPRSKSQREGSSSFLDRGKAANSWRSDVFEDGNNSSSFLMQNQDNGGNTGVRKEHYGGGGSYLSSRAYPKGGMREFLVDDFALQKGHRLSASGDGGGPFGRNLEIGPEFHDNAGEKYSDVGWGQGQSQGHSRGYSCSPYSEGDGLYSYGRSRYSMRQPRVLPPPSLESMYKTSFRGENECSNPSAFVMQYGPGSRTETTIEVQPESNMTQEQKLENSTTPRCDSQSSLSVSSPPSSPTHLSHDDLDECGEASAITEGKEIPLSGNDAVILNENCGDEYISGSDGEDWALDNNEEFQEQEEYDEDEDGYEEEDEVHEGDDECVDLTQEFEDLGIEDKSSSRMMENLVLGFDEGVEVGIPPSDEFERSSRNEESAFGLPEVSVSDLDHQRPHVDGIPDDVKAMQDSAPPPVSDLLDSLHGSNNSGICSRNVVASSVNTALHLSDLPVKLQFGLFSGPSLIPSPVPAIQIGSIQMPLHLHPPVGPSLGHMHPSQPPLFQFGQLRYTSSLSQGILPVAPQPVSFIPSSAQAHYNLNQGLGAPLPIQPGQENSSHNMVKDGVQSVSMDRECTENNGPIHKNQGEVSNPGEIRVISKVGFHGVKGHQDTVLKSFMPSSNGSVSEGNLPSEQDSRGSKAEGPQFGNKGRTYAYSGRNSGPRSSFVVSEGSRGIQRRPRWPTQRTEFRVRENVDRRHSQGLLSSRQPGHDDKSSVELRNVGNFGNSGSKKGFVVGNKPSKHIVEPEGSCSDPVGFKGTEARLDRRMEKEASTRTQSIAWSTGEGNLKRNISSEDDVDAPLQSGIVRVFNQPGIEAPSDGDDFIEVRSKRQMLNDRREQREKENKAKSRETKAPRKPRSAQNAVGSTTSSKVSVSLGGEAPNNINSNFVASAGRGLLNMEASAGFTTIVSQPLPPIGTPVALSSDMHADKRPHNIKSLQTGSASGITNAGKSLGPSLTFETKTKILDNVQSSMSSWDNAQINQQVMALTQTQLDEAMKPGRFDTYAASIGDHSMSNAEPIMPAASILTKDKSFTSTANPINSLLAGEKIQFGAVTSPTVLPPGGCTISHGIGAPGSSRSDVKISQTLSAAENDRTMFFEKDKCQNESCVDLEDCEAEAEAEAAASAVAVAAISSDEILGNGLGTCSVSVSDTKSFAGVDIDRISGGGSGDQQLAAQSRAEESLSVALPADLSVDNPSISLWPPLPSPQNASSQMLSHFPGGPPSHFPFYEMNPMLGGPIFAFGPHDDSAGTQSQNQKSTASASGPLGSWQQCHSGVDSFYGPPAGFTGPYISPPGGIPGVQCPPHMVVYNHFPVGQFGQVGLSFMGATYIPSGKQPDWKHNPTSSTVGSGEGDMNNNMNMVSAQRSPLNMPSAVQHLSPGSPLLPMASPFAMFDVSPFQSAPEMSVQGRWSHVPAPSLHSVPLSHPLQQPEAGVLLPSQFSHSHQSLTTNRFSESRTSTPSDGSRSFPVAPDSAAAQFPDERGLLDSSSSTGSGGVKKSSPGGTFAEVSKTDSLPNVNNSGHNTNAFKNHSTGYNYQRGGGVVSQKNGSGSEWSQHRRMAFHGRNQSLGAEKSFPPSSKVKQIYVAKQTTSGNSSAV